MKRLVETTRLISLSGSVPESGGEAKCRRRTCLPAPCPNSSSVSLWNILRNNIGKDLSKVAMPVELNEPLNTLQRLCEELEYSELLDKAACIPSALERMVRARPTALSSCPALHPSAGATRPSTLASRTDSPSASPLGIVPGRRSCDGLLPRGPLAPLCSAGLIHTGRTCHLAGRWGGLPCDSWCLGVVLLCGFALPLPLSPELSM